MACSFAFYPVLVLRKLETARKEQLVQHLPTYLPYLGTLCVWAPARSVRSASSGESPLEVLIPRLVIHVRTVVVVMSS